MVPMLEEVLEKAPPEVVLALLQKALQRAGRGPAGGSADAA